MHASLCDHLYTIRAFNDQDVTLDVRQLRGHQVPILLPAEIPSVQQSCPSDLDHKHGCSEYMSSVVAPEAYAVVFKLLMVVQKLDLFH